MIGIEGNKDPNLEPALRNVRSLVILEDREFGCADKTNLFWNPATGLFQEMEA